MNTSDNIVLEGGDFSMTKKTTTKKLNIPVFEETKKWYSSKTLWLNAAVILGIIAQLLTNTELPIDPELQAALLAIINIILRFVSSKPLAR